MGKFRLNSSDHTDLYKFCQKLNVYIMKDNLGNFMQKTYHYSGNKCISLGIVKDGIGIDIKPSRSYHIVFYSFKDPFKHFKGIWVKNRGDKEIMKEAFTQWQDEAFIIAEELFQKTKEDLRQVTYAFQNT